jgi:hypothetical protein
LHDSSNTGTHASRTDAGTDTGIHAGTYLTYASADTSTDSLG